MSHTYSNAKRISSTIFLCIASFLFLHIQAQTKCSEGCLICSSSGQCSLCDVENSYALNSSSECEKQVLENCLLSFTKDECEVCNSPFYSKSGDCTEVAADKQITGCIEYASESTCATCSDDHFLKSGTCEQLTSEMKVTDCLEYTEQGCELCLSGFPNYLKNKCHMWDDMDLNCQFYYKGQKCMSCVDGYKMDYTILSASSNSVYSKIFKQNLLFGKEKIGGLSQNLCTQVSSSGSNSSGLKVSCEDSLTVSEACVRCDSSTSFYDYKLNQCIKNPQIQAIENIHQIPNCLSLNLNFECVLCYNGFFLHYSKKKCLAHSTEVQHCLIMSQTVDSHCLVCEDTHYLNSANNSCLVRTSSVENCLEHNFFKDECNVCNSSFSLQDSNSKCLALPENCVDPVPGSTEPLSCSTCAENFHLFDGACEEIPAEKKIDFCTSYLKSTETDEDGNESTVFVCTECATSYTLVQNKFLLASNHTNFAEFTPPESVENPDKKICVSTNEFYRDLIGCKEHQDGECVSCEGQGQLYSITNSCLAYDSDNPKFIEGCNVYKSDDTCEQCIYSYKNETDGKCYTSNSSNCKLFKSSEVITDNPRCILCDDGFALHDGNCYSLSSVEADISNCLLYDARGQCIYCASGYINHYSSSQTQGQSKSHKCFDRRIFLSNVNADKILSCESFEEQSDGSIRCFSCIKGYELNKNDLCVPCLPHFLKSNLVDSFVFDKNTSKFYCKNDFSPTNEDCLYFADETFNRCLIYRMGIAGSHLIDELNNQFNYSERPLVTMSFFGDLKGSNWRNSRPASISQYHYQNSRKLTLQNPNSKLKHYLFQNNTDFVSKTILGAVCHLGYARNFSGLSLLADDCNSIVKRCDVKARVFYPGKTGHMISCSRCFGSDNAVYFTIEPINKSLLPDVDSYIQKGYSTAHIPSTMCYPNNLPDAVANCGVYELEVDGASYAKTCRACKPGFKPTYNFSNLSQITACTEIENCEFSSIGNICEMCKTGFGFEEDESTEASRQSCKILVGKVQYCLEWNGDHVSPTCNSCRPGYNSPSDFCTKSIYGDCSHFDDAGNCLKCEGINQIAFITNVIKQVSSGCLLGTYTKLPFCETQYIENKCFKCYNGFLLNSEGRCFSKHTVLNCSDYDIISQKCIKCHEEYYLDFDFQKCVPLYSPNKIVSVLDDSSDSLQTCEGTLNHFSYLFKVSVNKGLEFACASIGIENCKLLDLTKLTVSKQLECAQCQNSFEIQAVTPQKKCLFFAPIKNCESQVYDSNMMFRCERCISSHFLGVDGICYLRNNMPKCVSFYPNYDACKECEPDYYLDLSDNNTCKKRFNKNEKCETYFKFKDQCEVFNSQFQYVSERLYDLTRSPPTNAPENSDSSGNNVTESKNIPSCSVYSSEDICKECDSNTYLYMNQCKVVSTSVENCHRYKSKDTCSQCAEGYLLSENNCKLILALNCLVHENERKCRSCTFEFPYLDADFNCVKNPDVPNCKYYSTISNCKECEDTFQLTEDFKCLQVSSIKQNCVQYSANGKCTSCSNGYELKTEASVTSCEKVVGVDPFCGKAVSSGNRCAVCKSGYVLVDGICQKCDHLNPGCSVCGTVSRDVCLMCYSGYTMDSAGTCHVNESVFDSYIKLSYDI